MFCHFPKFELKNTFVFYTARAPFHQKLIQLASTIPLYAHKFVLSRRIESRRIESRRIENRRIESRQNESRRNETILYAVVSRLKFSQINPTRCTFKIPFFCLGYQIL